MTVSKVTPISEIIVCMGVPLTSMYTDTLTFSSTQQQYTYFNGKAKYRYTNAIPVRDNVIRIPNPKPQIENCNYCMYRNPNYFDKWFYCFITGIKWINTNCCEITVEDDVMQTWLFDMQLHPSYILRQHVSTDAIGQWIEPEPIDLGEKMYIQKQTTHYRDFEPVPLAMRLFYIPASGYPHPEIEDGVFMACSTFTLPATAANAQFLCENYIFPLIDNNQVDNVIGIQMLPGAFIPSAMGQPGIDGEVRSSITRRLYRTDLNGYSPANKKLFTYPFNGLAIGTGDGVQNHYVLEYFTTNEIPFVAKCSYTLDPVIVGWPENYGTDSTDHDRPQHDKVNISKGFPQGYFSGLESLAYLQNVASASFGGMTGMLNGAGPQVSDVGLAKVLVGMVESLFQQDYAMKSVPYASGGELPSCSTNYELWKGDFRFFQHCVSARIARDADTYLTRWGYAINKVDTINIRGRSKFNYVHTKDALVTGNIGTESLAKIKECFNNGITFWHYENGVTVGEWDGAASSNPIV